MLAASRLLGVVSGGVEDEQHEYIISCTFISSELFSHQQEKSTDCMKLCMITVEFEFSSSLTAGTKGDGYFPMMCENAILFQVAGKV